MDRQHPEGVCEEMCPLSEGNRRLKLNAVHRLERSPRDKDASAAGTVVSEFLPVKEYQRSAAGRGSVPVQDLRPPSVLLATVRYLFTRVLGRSDVPRWEVCQFVSNRCRAVLQDLIIQGLPCPASVPVLEAVVRFHLLMAYELCEEPTENFNPRMNAERIQNCFAYLLPLYKEASALASASSSSSSASSRCQVTKASSSASSRCQVTKASSSASSRCQVTKASSSASSRCQVTKATAAASSRCQVTKATATAAAGAASKSADGVCVGCRSELEAAVLIQSEDSFAAMSRAFDLPSSVRGSQSVQCALQMTHAGLEGNFVRFVRVSRLASPLLLCALHPLLLLLRRNALQTLNNAYASRGAGFPVSVLARWLAADSHCQAEVWCKDMGMVVTDGHVLFSKSLAAPASASARSLQKARLLISSALPPDVTELLLPSCCHRRRPNADAERAPW